MPERIERRETNMEATLKPMNPLEMRFRLSVDMTLQELVDLERSLPISKFRGILRDEIHKTKAQLFVDYEA
jgi:hypothetical protein